MASIKTRFLGLQFLLYACVGAIACGVDVGTFYLFSQLDTLPLIAATSISFSLATFANYLLCFKFIFDAGAIHPLYQIIRVFFVALVGLACNTTLFWFLTAFTSISAIWVKILVVPMVMIWNFWGRRKFVYSTEIPLSTLVLLDKGLKGKLFPFL
ncbi:MAG TPA: GtrA family protein, partial [Chlamydiales bacterium]